MKMRRFQRPRRRNRVAIVAPAVFGDPRDADFATFLEWCASHLGLTLTPFQIEMAAKMAKERA